MSLKVFKTLAAVLCFSAPAFAQVGEEPIGSVTAIEGEVIVARGAKTEKLGDGDLIFPGDRVMTRSDGTITISVADCSQSIEPTSSIVVDAEFCTKSPIKLAQGDVAPIAETGGIGGVGAAVGGGTLLAAAGVAAAASGGGGGGTPASP